METVFNERKERPDNQAYRDIGCHQVTAEHTEHGPVLTYKVRPGRAQYSHGLYVAKRAGLPEPIVQRAAEMLQLIDGRENKTANFVDDYLKLLSEKRQQESSAPKDNS